MARMIPAQCPPETASLAECELFAAFAKGLDAGYTVIHSLPWLDDSGRQLREGECGKRPLTEALRHGDE